MKDSFKVTFVTPHVGRKDPAKLKEYVRTWQMANLPVAVLAGLTPDDVEIAFYDERVEFIDFDAPTDLVGITIETYNAKRAYEIAGQFRRRGVPVIMGGYHAMLMPDEVGQYADSVLEGFAEGAWPQVIEDARRGQLQHRYRRDPRLPMSFGMPDRRILQGRNYLNLSLVETGRGCPQRCNFCSITAATQATYYPRPIAEVVADIATSQEAGGSSNVFFVDDNIVGNTRYAKDLFREVVPLKIRWFAQGTLSLATDEELLKLMADSGCVGLLVGIESLNRETLLQMDKRVNLPYVDNVKELIARLHRHGIGIYGTFIFGYAETLEDIRHTAEAAVDLGLFMAAFNPLIPFPGTLLYDQLLQEGRLADPQWYLDPDFRFGSVPFAPRQLSAADLKAACLEARRIFYSWQGIGRRATNWRGNLTDPIKAAAYLYINWQLRREISEKDGLPLGDEPFRPSSLERTDVAKVPV